MPELKGLCRKVIADRASGSFPYLICCCAFEVTFRCVGEKFCEMFEIGRCNLVCTGKFIQQRINSASVNRDTNFSNSGKRRVTSRLTDCFRRLRSETLSKRYLVSDFKSSLL